MKADLREHVHFKSHDNRAPEHSYPTAIMKASSIAIALCVVAALVAPSYVFMSIDDDFLATTKSSVRWPVQ